jgi:hypothetical protein
MRIAKQVGDSYQFMMCQYGRHWALLHSGRWQILCRALQEALDVATKNQNDIGLRAFQMPAAWMYAEAEDCATGLALVVPALRRAMLERDPVTTYLGHLIIARVQFGQDNLAGVRRSIDVVQSMQQDPRLLMEWQLQLVPLHAQAELLLKVGNWPVAMEIAKDLLDKAALTPERTYSAIAHQLLALCNANTDNMSEARRHLNEAVCIIQTGRYPLAA